MANPQDTPPFIPLVKRSSIVLQDNPTLPDDIELTHEKHRRVLGSWIDLDGSYGIHVSESRRHLEQTHRRRRILLSASICIICVGVVGIVYFAVGPLGLVSKQTNSEGGDQGATVRANLSSSMPSISPTERHNQAPVSNSLNHTTSEAAPTSSPTKFLASPEVLVTPPSAAPSSSPSNSPSPTIVNIVGKGSEVPTAQSRTPTLVPSIAATGDSPDIASSPRICNGLNSNCNQRVNDIMFATLHNAMSTEEDGFYMPRHELRLEDALEAGYRGLMIESCDCGRDGVQLCDASCAYGKRNPIRVFENVVDVLKRNPNDVIILVIKIDDDTLERLFVDAFAANEGLRSRMYDHGDSLDWPVLNDMIDMNKRLIVFQHGGPDCSQDYMCHRKIHNTFQYMIETPSNLTSTDDLLDFDKSCTLHQGSAQADFLISNHYVNGASGTADADSASIVNTQETIVQRLDACKARLGRGPSLFVVDFWSTGDVLQVVQEHNEQLARLG